MRAVLQKVTSATVSVNGEVVSSIQRGICALIGLSRDDDANDIEYIVRKLLNLRIFTGDAEKRWDKSVNDLQLEILCVSQFTLNALLKGNKLDFHLSMNPSEAAQFYCTFVDKLRQNYREDLVKGFMENLEHTCSCQLKMMICSQFIEHKSKSTCPLLLKSVSRLILYIGK
ncbi:D-aminoacyl-tRNA deacylase [Trichinella pseudospiralis]